MRKPLPANTAERPVWDTGPSPRANKLFKKQLVRLFALLLSIMSWNIADAQLTIGTGTVSSTYNPIYTFYSYNYTQSTYLQSEIVAAGAPAGTPGYISAIYFKLLSYYSFDPYCKAWEVFLGNTTKSTFSSYTDYVPVSSMTKVFTGDVLPTGTGWFKISFPTPFFWDGTSNLVVAVHENSPSYTSSVTFEATSRTGNRSIYYWQDGTDINPAAPSASSYGTQTYTPNIKIDFTAATPCSGTTVGGSAAASATTLCPGGSAVLTVTGSTMGTGLTYQWQSGTSITGPWTDITGATGISYTATPPTGTTTYYRRNITCTSTSSSASSTPVAVAVSAVGTVPYTETFEGLAKGVNATCAAVSGTWDGAWSAYYGYNWTLMNSTTSGYSGSNHTPGGSNYITAGYYIGTYAGYTAEYWFTPGIQLSTGKTYRFSYWYRVSDYMATYYPAGCQFGMYYNTAQSKTGLVAIKSDLTPEANATYKQNIGDFSVPADGVYFLAVKVDNKGYAYYGGGVIDDIGLVELPACNTATASTFGSGGKATASPNVICAVPGTTALSVTGTPPFSGLSFQWEMSTGTPTSFSSVAGATTATSSYSVSAAGTYYFRCKVTCAATGLTTYSDTVKVTTTPITPPYVEDFEAGTPGTNMPCAGSTYWGSSPYYWNIAGSPYATYCPGIMNHTPGGSKYLHAGYYLGYALGSAHFWFTPGLALTAGKAYNVSYWYSNSGYYPSSYGSYATEMGIYAGTAQTAAAMTISTGPDTTIYINAVGTPTYDQYVRGFIAPATGTYYVGIKVNHKNYCYYGFAIDDIGVDQIPPCSAKPAAGTATASPALICTSGTSTISLTGISLASDLSFQWQESTTGLPGSWVNSTLGTGATSPAYTTPVLSSGPMYYRCVVICGAISAPNADTSAPAKVSVGALDLPYVETFESGVDGVNMPCAGVAGTWSSSLQYWYLRSGAYSSSYPGVNNHTPGGKRYIYSGYYNGPYYSTGDQFYWFTPALKMTAGKGYTVGFWYNGTGYSTGTNGLKLGIYAGTTQSAAGMTLRAGGVDSVVDATSSTYKQMVRSFVAPTTGSYYVGIKTAHTGYNYPGIPLDDINVNVLPDCSAKPVAGIPDATPSLICTSGSTRLALTGTSVASGISYQWQSSTAGPTGPFTNATGTSATWGTYSTPTLTATTWYRCIVMCTVSGLSDTSSVQVVNVGAITPPYYETFESVAPGTNAPCASYSSSWGTATSTTYWTTKGFNYTAYGTVHQNHTPGGSNYLWAGYYFGYSPSAGATWFTPAIKLVKDSTYQFSFWYMGPGYYYYNSGTEFNVRYGTAQTEASMVNAVRGLWTDKRGNFGQFVGNFKAVATGNYYVGIRVRHTYSTYSYYGTSIDDIALEQLSPCSGVPTVGSIWAKPGMLCSAGTTVLDMDLSETSKASGLTYRWEYTTSDPTSGSFVPTGTSSVLTAPTFTTPTLSQTTWFRCIVKCSYTGDSTISAVTKVDVSVVTPPYFQTFETVDQGSNAPCASNTGTFSSSSFIYWNVLRVPISTSYAAIDNHTPKGTAYLIAGYYNGSYYSSAQWWFTPKVRLTGGNMYYFSYWYRGSGYAGGKTNLTMAYGTSNTAAGMTTTLGTPLVGVNTYVWQKHDARFTPTATGDYYMGIKVDHTSYTYPGIAIDDIGLQEVPPCSSTVVAGTITSNPAHVCSAGGTALLDLDGSTLATGLTYEWFSSTSPTGPFVTTGGTSLPYTTDPLSATTYFRCVVTCAASGKSDTTAVFKMGVGGRDLPYIEDFETTAPGSKPLCSDATAWGNYYYDAWNTYAGTYTGSYTNHTPGGRIHLVAGYYLGCYAYSPVYPTVTNDNFWFTPGLNLRSGYKYNLNFWFVGASGGYVNKMAVHYGRSQSVGAMTGTIFPLRHVNNSAYANIDTAFTVPTSGVYYLGFKKTTDPGSWNYYGIAFDDINLNYAPCDGSPAAGVISGTVPSGTSKCKYTYVKLTDVGATVSLVPGIKYQWYRRDLSVPSSSWSVVVGATDTVLASDTLIGYEYKLAVICRNTNDTVYSAAYQLPQLPPHPAVNISPSTTPITFCVGDTVKFNATNFTSGVYDWMRDSVVVPGWKFSDLGATDPGTYMVKVTSPLSPCPAYSNQVKLIANDPGYTVSITLPADSILCAGSSVLLTAVSSKPGVTFQWRKDNVAIPGATGSTYLVTTGGYYRVMASDGVSSCAAASRNIAMIVKPNPPAVITVPGGTTTACENEGVLLQASLGGYTYEWMRGGAPIYGLIDSAIVVKNSGTYMVKVRNADGCASYSSPITVNILPSPVPVIVRTGDTLSTTVSYPFYQWIRNGVDIPGAVGPKYVIKLKGFYKVRVTGTNNCDGESTPIEAMDNWLSIDNSSVVSSEIKVYPNPTMGKVNIESPVPVQVQVKDLSGRVVIQGRETKEVDLSKLADGVYLFVILDKDGTQQIAQQRVTKMSADK